MEIPDLCVTDYGVSSKHQEISIFFYQGCLMTGCANGGSCVSNEEKQTYSCVCKKQWTGEKCEVKIGK